MASRMDLVDLLVCFLLLSYNGVEAARGLYQTKLEIQKQFTNLKGSTIENTHGRFQTVFLSIVLLFSC